MVPEAERSEIDTVRSYAAACVDERIFMGDASGLVRADEFGLQRSERLLGSVVTASPLDVCVAENLPTVIETGHSSAVPRRKAENAIVNRFASPAFHAVRDPTVCVEPESVSTFTHRYPPREGSATPT